ncbi:hypothetical protein [Oryza sativa Japonica Group]|uniref:Uncharacterized protein n=1 Tax=Oryza sativa subsp. japonica TaxID=39947 RepID=Q5NAT1_ORYSJ|nr:hypothetical protein [Oryza sativa Japonica Group]BAD81425.1 hypothetical protein [Oryza sativa Japonica Group]
MASSGIYNDGKAEDRREVVAYRPLGGRFLKIVIPEGGESDVADGRSLSGDGRQRNL